MGGRLWSGLVAGALVATLALASPAMAQVVDNPATTTTSTTAPTTTTTSQAPTTSTTSPPVPTRTAPPLQVLPTTTTTAPPPPQQSQQQPPQSATYPAGPELPEGLPSQMGETVPEDAGPFPPELEALVASVKRTAPNDTTRLLAALAPLERFGLDETARAMVGFGAFPVAGPARWDDDWWTPRFGPGWRLHLGLDIAATKGTPVRSPTAGTVHISDAGMGGLGLNITQPDHTYWYLAHLGGLAPGLHEGQDVVAGQLLAYVGDSGDAAGAPHTHVELHPHGGGAVEPKPYLDRMVADAIAAAPALVQAYESQSVSGVAVPATVAPAAGTHELITMLLSPLTPAPLRWVLAR